MSFGTKFAADLFVLLTYNHNIILLSKTESIAKSIGIGIANMFCCKY